MKRLFLHSAARRRRTLVMLLALTTFTTFAVVAHARDHSWNGFHWARTSNPFTLKVGDNVDSRWDSHLDVAISDWSQSSVLDLVKVAGGTRPKSCRPTTGRIEVCNANYGNTTWLGIAQIWLSGGHIVQGTSKMNDTYFDTPTYNTSAWRQLVMCQEIAHDFGLDHQDENFNNANLGTCMDYTNNPGTNQHPNQHDYAQLEEMYAHLDSTTTVGQTVSAMPPAANDIDFAGPAQWGRVVRVYQDGRPAVYELDFGNGNKILTHVFWTIDGPNGRGRAEGDEHEH